MIPEKACPNKLTGIIKRVSPRKKETPNGAIRHPTRPLYLSFVTGSALMSERFAGSFE
jgi:hypothetical protein